MSYKCNVCNKWVNCKRQCVEVHLQSLAHRFAKFVIDNPSHPYYMCSVCKIPVPKLDRSTHQQSNQHKWHCEDQGVGLADFTTLEVNGKHNICNICNKWVADKRGSFELHLNSKAHKFAINCVNSNKPYQMCSVCKIPVPKIVRYDHVRSKQHRLHCDLNNIDVSDFDILDCLNGEVITNTDSDIPTYLDINHDLLEEDACESEHECPPALIC